VIHGTPTIRRETKSSHSTSLNQTPKNAIIPAVKKDSGNVCHKLHVVFDLDVFDHTDQIK
jgi:hypothetical protein